jgi:hypothetical protein
MILLKKGNIDDFVLRFLESTDNNTYYFEFVNDMTKDLVSLGLEDTSDYKYSYHLFTIDVNDYFLNANPGFWTYYVYDNEEDKNLIKLGKMKLVDIDFNFTEYNGQDEEFISYNN